MVSPYLAMVCNLKQFVTFVLHAFLVSYVLKLNASYRPCACGSCCKVHRPLPGLPGHAPCFTRKASVPLWNHWFDLHVNQGASVCDGQSFFTTQSFYRCIACSVVN